MKRVLAGVMALLVVAGGTSLPANVRGGGLFARSAITASAEELRGYVDLRDVQVNDIIGYDVEYLIGEGYTIVLQEGGYCDEWNDVGDSDHSMGVNEEIGYSLWEWVHNGNNVSAFIDRSEFATYYPYYNGEKVDSWKVVSKVVSEEGGTITLTGYAETQSNNLFTQAVNYRQYNESGVLQDNGILEANTGIKVESDTVNWTDGTTYVVSENVTITKRIEVTGTVNLILLDGATLTASKGVSVNGVDEYDPSSSANTLNIYAGSTSDSVEGTGALVADARGGGWKDENAGLGGDTQTTGGILNIHGGVITAYGNVCGAGIGGGNGCSHETITIYDGTINATGGTDDDWGSAGIGGGFGATGGTVYIYGGTVNATGTGGSAGIGGGSGTSINGSGGSVYIYGGTVNATGGNNSAMGIGAAAGGSSNGTLILGEGLALQNKNDDTWEVVEASNNDYARTRYMRTAKTLFVGQYIGIGDIAYILANTKITFDGSMSFTQAGNLTLNGIEYSEDHYELIISLDVPNMAFDEPIGISLPASDELTPAPTGFWIIDGEGTADDPFILSLDPPPSVTYTHVEAVDPTCTTAGNIEYYEGSDGKYYADDQGTLLEDQNEDGVVDENDITRPATGHSYGTPTYSWTEENGVWKCTATRTCTHVASHIDTETVNGSYAEVTPATVNTVGTGRWTATFTNNAFTAQTKDVEIAKLVPEKHDAVAPTCTTAGNIEYYTYGDKYYTKNGETYTEITQAQTVDPATGHAFAYEANGNVLTVTCTHGCDEYGDGVPLSINCPPGDLEYDGNYKGAVLGGLDDFCDVTGLSISEDDIVYGQLINEAYQEMDSAPIDAGTYRASLTVVGQTISVEYDIEKIDVDESEYSAPTAIANLTYDGTPKTLATEGSSEYGTMMYSFGTSTEPFENWTDDISNLREVYAGTYYIWYYVEGDVNHNDTDPQYIEVEVGKASLNPSVSVEGWTYGETQNAPDVSGLGTEQIAAIGVNNITGELWKYNGEEFEKVKGVSLAAISLLTGTTLDAGTYKVKLVIAENDNYEDGEWESEEFIVAKAGSSVTGAPTAISGLIYDGTEQELIEDGSTDDGTMVYSLDGTNWDEDIPTGIGAGTYTVYYKIVGDDNHNDTEPATITVEIAMATPTADNFIFTEPNDLTYTGGAKAADVVFDTQDNTLSGIGDITVKYYSDENRVYEVEPVDAGTYYVGIVVDEGDNYNAVSTVLYDEDWTFTIEKADLVIYEDYTVPTGLTATYGQTLADVIIENPEGNIAGTWTWEDELDTLVGGAGEQTFCATFTPEDTTNYNTIENVEITLTVNKASNPLTVSITGWTYGEAANEPSVEGNYTDGVTYQYAVYGSDEWSDEVPTQAGEYIVKATVAESANYEAGEGTEDFVIYGIDISNATILIDKDTFALSDTPCEPNVYFVTLGSTLLTVNVDYTVSYENNDGISNGTPAVVITGKGNYAGIVKKTFTIGIDLSKAEIELSSNSFTYDGNEKRPRVASVKLGGEIVNQDDYVISYSDNVNAGTATVTVTANQDNTDGVTGSAATTFTISKAGIASVSAIGSYEYNNGEAIIPELVVKDENDTVVNAANYNVELFNNVESGTAIIVVTAKAGTNYTGTKTGTFEIGHKYTAVDEVEAGCGAAGVKGHWVDENGTAYLKDTNEEYVAATAAELAIPATGAHDYNTEDIQWYWTTDNSGAFAVFTCETCGTTTNVNAVVTSEAVAGGTQYTATVVLGDDEYSVSKIVENTAYVSAYSEVTGYEIADDEGRIRFKYNSKYDGDAVATYGVVIYRDGELNEALTVTTENATDSANRAASDDFRAKDLGNGVYVRPYVKVGTSYIYGDTVFVRYADLVAFRDATAVVTSYEIADNDGRIRFSYSNIYTGTEETVNGVVIYRDGILNDVLTVETAGATDSANRAAVDSFRAKDIGNGVYVRSYIKIGDKYKYGDTVFVRYADLVAFRDATADITSYEVADNEGRIRFNYCNTYTGTQNAVNGVVIYRNGELNEELTVNTAGATDSANRAAVDSFRAKDLGNGVYVRPYIKINGTYKYGDTIFVRYADLVAFRDATATITGYEKADNEGRIRFHYSNAYSGNETAVHGVLIYRNGVLNDELTVDTAGVTNSDNRAAVDDFRAKDLGNGIYVRPYIKIGDTYKYGEQVYVKYSEL